MIKSDERPKIIDLYTAVARGVQDDDNILDKAAFLSDIKKLSFDEMFEWYELYVCGN